MIPPEGQDIIDKMARGDSWAALGVSKLATLDEINTAHLKLRHKFRAYPEVQAALNEALNKIKIELSGAKKVSDSIRKESGEYVPKETKFISSFLVPFITSLPIRFFSIACTFLVFWNLHNWIFLVITGLLFYIYIKTPQKDDTDPLAHLVPGFLVVWVGFSASLFLLLNKIFHVWTWVSVILSVVVAFLIGAYSFNILSGIYEKISKRNLWIKFGVTCMLFMLTFGLEYLIISDASISVKLIPITAFIQNTPWLYTAIMIALDTTLFVFFLGIFTGNGFNLQTIYWTCLNSSESKFILYLISANASLAIMHEFLYYSFPFFRQYYSQVFIGDLSHSLLSNMGWTLLYQFTTGLIAFIIFSYFIWGFKKIFNKQRLSSFVEVLVGYLSILVSPSFYVTIYNFVFKLLSGG